MTAGDTVTNVVRKTKKRDAHAQSKEEKRTSRRWKTHKNPTSAPQLGAQSENLLELPILSPTPPLLPALNASTPRGIGHGTRWSGPGRVSRFASLLRTSIPTFDRFPGHSRRSLRFTHAVATAPGAHDGAPGVGDSVSAVPTHGS